MFTFENMRRDLFIPMRNIIDSCIEGFEDTTIENFNVLYKTAIEYPNSSMSLELDTESADEFVENCMKIDLELQSIFKQVSERFNIEITVDDYYEFKQVYNLFVGNRMGTIANAILYLIATNHLEDLPKNTNANDDWENLKKNLILSDMSLSDILDTYYMECCMKIHSFLTFNSIQQDFYSCFSQQDNRESEFKSVLESERLKKIIVHNLTVMKLKKITGGQNEKD